MGAIVDAAAILISGILGVTLKNGMPQAIHERVLQAMGLVVITLGLGGAVQMNEPIVFVLSMAVGTFIGEWLDLDLRVRRGVNYVERRFRKEASGPSLSQGFIAASMLVCVGAMAIVGSLESGLNGDNTTLYIKSLIDGITIFLLASSLGAGVILSAIPVLVWQGGIILFASSLQPFLSAAVIAEVSCIGSVLIMALGLNMLDITDLKIMNFTPAIFIPMLLMQWI